ncbi:acetoacetate metabolism regulatory protein AtoC [Desulfomarina profundi]|uniref:Acetoacetate metabolism regulatory protein AtoC n=1 Tax=Desulfomarina profundi TaxID=2772557 RepID=A0A8D5JRF5_9BACT|nr:sigma-54 dependent transcriptional regulator [Desulfomarina profundi]BCL60996.1 acetoacetate metabolism regulatory protein AtoC [Desulfomarina profundi]
MKNNNFQAVKRILVIDDEKNMRHMLGVMLEKNGYQVTSASDGLQAIDLVRKETYDFVLCDVRMPEIDGLQFLVQAKNSLGSSTVIMMSAYGTVEMALEAMKAGAYDFISKPFKVDEVLLTLKKAEEREQLKAENRELKKIIKEKQEGTGFEPIVGESAEIKKTIQQAQKIAQYDASVLITGESGTGKELVAKGIHKSSSRGNMVFYAVNCGSIPGELLESELFGYVKGAFTGADRNKKGILELADGSTLFLDEIGELPLDMQVKLLRVLQEKEIHPLGAALPKKINVRILAATSRTLEEEVALGNFRQDLFYRLNVLTLHLPPLRERTDDIPHLCSHFLRKYNKKFGTSVQYPKGDVIKKMVAYHWPGNVRELENRVQRGVVFANGDDFAMESLQHGFFQEGNGSGIIIPYGELSLKKAQKILEKKIIDRALKKTGGNKSRAAHILEISYPSLLNKIKEYGI